ncbi:rhomboid family intramembrane serine protease [Aurantimonas sp. VKM B-3413]|uniref:rhomboid family intramembrane serine protease n=1 Tax=Aurantimonas sp. VKM B-3413 TaxID=2779401 RepID=UPI001E5A6250|nr:rhomboid family intramembrane serine protease [Aurantimonas sp. VKM B-3413]MCB8840144.1 rhomboid family intramembrane serine protease [Aurantimonas sp. VKM B-3413]
MVGREDGSGVADETSPRPHPPIFNIPGIIAVLIVAFAAVHILRTMVLGDIAEARFLIDFSFIPGCYAGLDDVCRFRDAGAGVWSPLTYAFLHGGWMHFGVNSLWLVAFGAPVARRLGTGRFLVYSALGAIAGAAVFYLVNPALIVPVIGASGVVSALMGGACRFAFTGQDPSGRLPAEEHRPRASIAEALSNRTVLIFIIVFFATNLLIGSGVGGALGGGEVAWEAHLGGFLFGFLALPAFDPVPATRG